MLGNLVNRHDFVRLAEKIAADGIEPLVARFVRRRGARVRAAWADGADATSQWWMIAAVRRRWATMVCGQPDLDFPEWMRRRHLAGRNDLVGLSVGCGTGYRVARWAALGIFRRIDAFDLSPGRVAAARSELERQGVGDRVALRVADMATVALPDAGYDVVIGEQALHHFTGLDATFARLARSLRPDGILYVDEFVGPTRHQWTARQLAAANDLLRQLPEAYRRTLDGRVKRLVMRPSILRMLITDPSEAVESGRLQAVLRDHFDVIEQHGYGGGRTRATPLRYRSQLLRRRSGDAWPPRALLRRRGRAAGGGDGAARLRRRRRPPVASYGGRRGGEAGARLGWAMTHFPSGRAERYDRVVAQCSTWASGHW